MNETDSKRCTALRFAANSGYSDCVDILLNAGANVNATDCKRSTALVSAVQRRRYTCY